MSLPDADAITILDNEGNRAHIPPLNRDYRDYVVDPYGAELRDRAMKCEGKQRFHRWRDAELAAKRTRWRGYGRTMGAYRCPECHGFHIGHSRNLNKKFRIKGLKD